MTASDLLLRAARIGPFRGRGAAGPALVVAALAVVALGACGGGEEEPPPPAEPLSEEDAAIAAHISEKTMLLWDIYNEYDLEGLRALYEESYWEEEKAELESNMAPFRSRGIQFTAEETSPPMEIEPGKWQVKQKARFSGGSVNMKFIYEEFDGEWLLTYAETD